MISIDITQYEIEITHHAFFRAIQRGITPDMFEAVIQGGKIHRFGKHYVRFGKKYKNCTVICIGFIETMKIKIITIERK